MNFGPLWFFNVVINLPWWIDGSQPNSLLAIFVVIIIER